MSLPLESVLVATRVLVSISIVVQVLELWALRFALGGTGPFSWALVGRDAGPLKPMLEPLMGRFVFTSISTLRLVALALLWVDAPVARGAAVVYLIVSTYLASLRFGGSFNGGSDSMTLYTVVALAGAMVWGDIFLALLATHVVLSIFLAGVAKLRESTWRSGSALSLYFEGTAYDVPPVVRRWATRPALMRALAWGTLAFELGFPFALLNAQLAMIAIGVALAFHLAVFYVFGLNRFFFAWLAAYPAVAYWACGR